VNCYVHQTTPAIGVCVACGKAACRDCVGGEHPRLVCRACASGRAVFGYEFRTEAGLGSWPLVHICTGVDPATGRPRVARGVIAIGNVAVGGLAAGGLAVGLLSFGGLSIGLLVAVGGAALGLGLSVGGFALGSIAVGGLAIGFSLAVGGGAFGPAVIDGQRCDAAARALVTEWLGAAALPPSCR
jgi:hypothetical protein